MKKVYVTGSAGLVGSRFIELMGDKYNLLTPEINDLNITKINELSSFWEKEKPDMVVHFAAITDVGESENQRGNMNGSCWKVNVGGTENLTKICKKHGTFMVNISTDYVFSGGAFDKGPYKETHKPEKDETKLSWYGYTKAIGEEKVHEILGNNTCIVRIVYPVRANYSGKPDYLKKPLQLYREKKLHPLFNDQQISITFIDEACIAIDKIISGNRRGIYHVCSSDTTTPYDLISYYIKQLEGDKVKLKSASIDDFYKKVNNPVRYPKYGGLDSKWTEKQLNLRLKKCKEIVDELIMQGGE
ncbi:SDR family oxidoreductase [Patescibacteria group bacterium]